MHPQQSHWSTYPWILIVAPNAFPPFNIFISMHSTWCRERGDLLKWYGTFPSVTVTALHFSNASATAEGIELFPFVMTSIRLRIHKSGSCSIWLHGITLRWGLHVKSVAPWYKLKIRDPSPHARQISTLKGALPPILEHHIPLSLTHSYVDAVPTLHIATTPIKVIRRIFGWKGDTATGT